MYRDPDSMTKRLEDRYQTQTMTHSLQLTVTYPLARQLSPLPLL